MIPSDVRLACVLATLLTSAGLVAMAQHCSSILYLNTEEVAGLGEEATNKMLSRLGPQLKGLFIDGEGLDDGAFANLKKCEKLEVRTIFFEGNDRGWDFSLYR